MSQASSHLEFAPPEESGGARSLTLALFVHALLLMALTWGIHWRTDPQDEGVEAELWSNIPEPVALKSDAPAPPEPDANAKAPPPLKNEAPPAAKVIEPPSKLTEAAAKIAADAEIAIEKRRKKEEAEQLAREKQAEKIRKAQELEAEKERKAALLREEAAKRKEEEAKRKEEEAKRKEEEIRLRKEEEARRKEEEARRIEQEAKEAEEQRQKTEKRLKSLGASATGPVDPVNESKGSGKPSDSYLGRLRARVKPNITFSESQLQSVRGNPAAEVEVIVSPSGQIMGMKLTQSSGNAAWDQAVLKAIEKTATLPRDENGKIPPKIPFVFRPRD